MLDPDTPEAARHATRIVSDDRAAHFYDANQKIGKAIAQQLGGPGEIAWDMYLFYDRASEWVKTPPPPLEWMHQLEGRWWADLMHLYCGEHLAEKLYTTMHKLETS